MNSRRWLLPTMILALIVSTASALLIFNKARSYYGELNATKLDPLGLREFKMPEVTSNLVLVYCGDSRAAQWPEPVWLRGKTMNFGIGGQTTEQILARFDIQMAALKPRVVLLEAGINDLKAIPLFPENEQAIIERCEANLRAILLRCEHLGSEVILSTIFPLGKIPLERKPFWSDRVQPALETVNQFIETLASERVTILHSGKVLSDSLGNFDPPCSRDFLHLTAEGYERLNRELRKCMAGRLDLERS